MSDQPGPDKVRQLHTPGCPCYSDTKGDAKCDCIAGQLADEWEMDIARRHMAEARIEALERAVVVLFDDVSDHLPDDILATVAACRKNVEARAAALAAGEERP